MVQHRTIPILIGVIALALAACEEGPVTAPAQVPPAEEPDPGPHPIEGRWRAVTVTYEGGEAQEVTAGNSQTIEFREGLYVHDQTSGTLLLRAMGTYVINEVESSLSVTILNESGSSSEATMYYSFADADTLILWIEGQFVFRMVRDGSLLFDDPPPAEFQYATELLIAIDERGWPACPVDIEDFGEKRVLADLYGWLLTHVVRVPAAVTMPIIDALVAELGCQWVGWSVPVTLREEGGAFVIPASEDPVTGVEWEFNMVQLWGDRFSGEWWPQAFLCQPHGDPTRSIGPRMCTRASHG